MRVGGSLEAVNCFRFRHRECRVAQEIRPCSMLEIGLVTHLARHAVALPNNCVYITFRLTNLSQRACCGDKTEFGPT